MAIPPSYSSTEITSLPEIIYSSDENHDSSSPVITCHRLTGNNYLKWSQSVKIFLSGRDRLGYVTGDTEKPATTAANYSTWMRENSQVMSWLLNSMSPSVGRNFLLYQTVVEIWSAIQETYSSVDNISEMFGIEGKASSLKKDGMTVTLYYNTLNALWQQLDLYADNDWETQKDAALYKTITAHQIIGTSPLPSLREAYSTVKREESRRLVMMPDATNLEGSALLTHSSSSANIRRGRPWCNHCKKPGHPKDKCWKIQGKAHDWKPRTSNSGRDASPTLTKEQMVEIQKLFEKFQVPHISKPPHTPTPTLQSPITAPSPSIIGEPMYPLSPHVDSTNHTPAPTLTQNATPKPTIRQPPLLMRVLYQVSLLYRIWMIFLLPSEGVRACTKYPIKKFVGYNSLMPSFQAFTTTLDATQIPTNVDEALKHPRWRQVVQVELDALEKIATWTLTTLPPGKKAVGCKWIFVIKYNSNGSIRRYKARLVTKGFTQTHGIDYIETFAPVAKLNTVRVLLSLAVNLDWNLHQMDVKNAFINGNLKEEVYMKIPHGLSVVGGTKKVCRLNRSLYGLMQSHRAWFERFTKVLLKHNFVQSLADHTLFIKKNSVGKQILLLVYVDDIIITGDDKEGILLLKRLLTVEFETKDLGKLRYFLGMEVARSPHGLGINQ
ncbi:hypothetical protein GQ457_14G013760 [Hibiscus cannabinus]